MSGKASVKSSHNHFALLVASLQVICHQLWILQSQNWKGNLDLASGVKIENLLWHQIEKLKLNLILIGKSLTFFVILSKNKINKFELKSTQLMRVSKI